MSDTLINERIINGLKLHCEGDDAMYGFLLDLAYREAEHGGQWQWKAAYRQGVKQHSAEWGGFDED